MTSVSTPYVPPRGSWTVWPLVLLWMATLIVLSSKTLVSPPIRLACSDKIAHAGAYGCLGYLLAFARLPAGRDSWARVALVTVLVMAFGILTELCQSTLPHRDASAGDVAADAFGGFFAAAATCVYRRNRPVKESV